MGKKPNRKEWADRLLDPLKQRLTLTEQAPMRKGSAVKKAGKKVPEPLSNKARQVKELKTMFNIGVKDPERLARIISRMLKDDNAREEQSQLRFERLIWEKAEKKSPSSPDEI
jgi:hypothetical protein